MLSKSKALLSRNARHLRPKRQNRGVLLVFTIIFTVYSIVLLFPFIWLFINSFKDGIKEFTDNPWGLPQSWKFENYAMIFQMENFNVLEMFGNTLILSIAVPTASCLSTTLAAYVMAKFKFKGHGILYAVYLIPMLVAITGTTSSLYMLIDSWGLIGSFTGIIIMAASGTGMNFLLVYSLFKNVDNAYMEAARIDGANEFRIFGQIMLPHAMGLVGTLWVLGFIGSWNDYVTPKIFLGGDKYTIATGIEKIGNMVETADPIMMQNYPAYFAAIILSILPIIVIFFIFQKQIMKISLGGGIK